MEPREHVGRRISALRAGLHAAAERFDELLVEAQERAPDLAGQIEEAKGDVETALRREERLRNHSDKGGA